jgi:hypothetical protein
MTVQESFIGMENDGTPKPKIEYKLNGHRKIHRYRDQKKNEQ